MGTLGDTEPKQFLAGFITSLTEELVHSDEEPAAVIDRYHTPDIVQIADGHRMDREKLIAHARPVRKNRSSARMEVHEAMVDGDRLAARYTLHATTRKRAVSIEVHFFGRFAPDGRMREAHMLTRTLPAEEPLSAP